MKKLVLSTVLGIAMIIGSATMAFAASTNGTPADNPLPGYPGSEQITVPLSDDVNNQGDNNIGNANQTGTNVNDPALSQKGDVIKSQDMNLRFDANGNPVTGDVTQRTHGEYQNNTNSCASCHQTHTGAADNLLFKSSIYDTCTACHDGTLGFYNVFTGSTAGTFGGTATGNASMHMPNGTLETKAAPGGNTAEKGSNVDGIGEHTWTAEFTCASCHAPHGSYSSRLLNFNPNGIASVPYYDADGSITGTADSKTGGQMVRDVVVNTLPDATTATQDFVIYETQAGNVLEASIIKDGVNNYSASADGKTVAPVTSASTVVVVMKKSGTGATATWVRDTQPWLYAGEYREVFHDFKAWFTSFFPVADLPMMNVNENVNRKDKDSQVYNTRAGIAFANNKGFAVITGTFKDNAKIGQKSYTSLVGLMGQISRAYVVNLTMDSASEWFGTAGSGVKITQVSPSNYSDSAEGPAISNWCGSCHTDYFANSSNDQGTGVWTKAFRHTTTSATYTCLKCHFAHGTDVTVMMDAQDRGIAKAATDLFAGDTDKATAYLKDLNPSSALKRYTNMSVCWKCHTSSHNYGLTNNDYLWNVKQDSNAANNLTNGFTAPANDKLPYFKATANVVDETIQP